MPVPNIRLPEQPNILNQAIGAFNLGTAMEQRSNMRNAAILAAEETKRRGHIESAEYALNLLAGVTNSEDLDRAKRLFGVRYPDRSQMINQILPYYDADAVRQIRNSIRTEAQRLKLEEKPELKGFGPGTDIYKGEEKVGSVPPTPPKETPQWEVFEKGGSQIYVRKGDPIPEGYTKVVGKGVQVTVQTGDLSKTTKARLEDAVIEGTRSVRSFQATRRSFKPEYLTMFGKGDKIVAELADKAGLSSKAQRRLIRERSKWFRQAKADFIAYRKWATGVAGGEKEMAEIATSFPDPVKNSPTQYNANLDNIEETTKKILQLNKEFLASGIDINLPLEEVLERAKGIGVVTSGAGSPGNVIIRFNAQGERVE